MSPTDTRDDRDAALSRNQARYEAREQAADDRCSESARDVCGAKPVVTNLDGEDLCLDCANAWVRGEGIAAAYDDIHREG